jgi:glycosyltransferase involved in cell wall biosynthesis
MHNIHIPKISFILPTYNDQDYLKQSLDSLVQQTYSDIEIICVNDGSTDNTLAILKSYAKKDNRITIIDQSNMGVAEARNNAIKISQGEYLMFTDGDDWLEIDACEILMNIIEEYNPDVVMYAYIREYEDKALKKHIFDDELIVFNKSECKKLHRRHAGIIGSELKSPESADALCSLSTKLFKSSIIKQYNIKYIDNKIIGTYGDGLFNLFYYEYVKKAVYINKYLYHYRKTNVNSIVTAYKPTLPILWNNMFDIIENYIDKKSLGSEFSEGLSNRIALSSMVLGLNVLSSDKGIIKKFKEVSVIIRSPRYCNAVESLNINFMPIHWKFFYTSAKYKITIFVLMLLFAIQELKKRI